MINEIGQCCGRKPLHYKSGRFTPSNVHHLFCSRCDAAYDPKTKQQMSNWAWEKMESGDFVRRIRRRESK